jgi:hypothetical protein
MAIYLAESSSMERSLDPGLAMNPGIKGVQTKAVIPVALRVETVACVIVVFYSARIQIAGSTRL